MQVIDCSSYNDSWILVLGKDSRSRGLSASAVETAGAATLVTMTGAATDAEVVEALEVLY
jgi:hypothetical protein